jgi:hypothetical protein
MDERKEQVARAYRTHLLIGQRKFFLRRRFTMLSFLRAYIDTIRLKFGGDRKALG